ncbi:MAG: TlyA family RNA methyltransferase [Natronincolaceae bacterium]|jgi:23S rRNA (cytidine1920-2'-O)/16S rRNA (cytidine1409-2'-O)-methyltransferase
MGKKERIDTLLVQKGFFDSRERAKRSIMAGIVFVDNQKVDKPGTSVNKGASISVRGDSIPYVSRGGLKLEKAIDKFNIPLDNKICLDIGASTGGFTDCMLQKGAKKVYSIDVGYGQLDWKLRQDPKVVVMERTNIRYVTRDDIGEMADFASIDVSFISLKLVLPVLKQLLKKNGEIVALIKPQFEAGREKVGKGGVVRDIEVHKNVVSDIVTFATGIKLQAVDFTYSPIRGPKGNIEYLLYMKNTDIFNNESLSMEYIDDIINQSHLNNG